MNGMEEIYIQYLGHIQTNHDLVKRMRSSQDLLVIARTISVDETHSLSALTAQVLSRRSMTSCLAISEFQICKGSMNIFSSEDDG